MDNPFDVELENSEHITLKCPEEIPIYNIASSEAMSRDPRPFLEDKSPEWVKVTLHRAGGWWAEIVFHNGIAIFGRAHSPGSPLRKCGDWRPMKNLEEIASKIKLEAGAQSPQ